MPEKPTERKTYGLPPLTTAEAARVLDVPEIAFMKWIEEVVKPSGPERSMWVRGRRDLPEELIRLYLTNRPAGGVKLLLPEEKPPGSLGVVPPEPTRARRRGTMLSRPPRKMRRAGE